MNMVSSHGASVMPWRAPSDTRRMDHRPNGRTQETRVSVARSNIIIQLQQKKLRRTQWKKLAKLNKIGKKT